MSDPEPAIRPILFLAPELGRYFPAWRDAMAALGTPWRLVQPGEAPDEAILSALVYHPPPGSLAALPNLVAIASISAGIEYLIEDPTLPPTVPLLRLDDAVQAAAMVEYVLYAVLRLHRGFDRADADQHTRRWAPLRSRHDLTPASARRVSVLGRGAIGLPVAQALAALGFATATWGRSPHPGTPAIEAAHGAGGLAELLPRTDILICLLPLTPDTTGILNAATFAAMPPGSAIINVGRGDHLVEADLIPALDAGQLSGAVLDVFQTEPLPADHPFWADPRVTVTPHSAAASSHEARTRSLVESLDLLMRGRPAKGVIDRALGY